MTSTRRPSWDVPAVHIEQPIYIPSSEQVRASFTSASDSEITTLITAKSGEAEVCVHRHDWPDAGPFVSVGLLVLSDGIEVYIDGNHNDPMQVWQRLTELANAASVASQHLLAMIAAGTWQ